MGMLARIMNSFRGDAASRDAADELAWHLEQRTREYMDQGMSEEEARAAARRRIGNVTLLEEDTTESDLLVSLETIKRDIAFAFRMLLRAPVVTTIAIVSLALGIGPNTVVFTLMRQVVLDYLPVPEPGRLVILHNSEPEFGHVYSNGMQSSFSYPLYRDLNAATSRIFDGILALRSASASLTVGDSAETLRVDAVSDNFFQVLKVNPWRGRLLTPGDDQAPGANPVAVIGYGLWKRSFGGDAGIVNRTILLNRHAYTVVGIAPPQFYGIDVSSRADVFVPISMKEYLTPDGRPLNDRLDHWCSLIARLKSGVSLAQATAALNAIYPPLRDQDLPFIKTRNSDFKAQFARKKVNLSPGGKGYADIREQLSQPLTILMAMVGLVLLITIVNVANLLVARGVARQREMAIRVSVGAGKTALMRQLMIESLALSLLGGALGVAFAYAATPVLLRLLGLHLSQGSISAHPDWRVLLFSAATTVVAGVAFGLLPAWQSARTDVVTAIKGESGHSHTGRSLLLRRGLIVGQVALSLILVSAGILFTRSLRNLRNIDVGFNTAHLLTFEVNPLQAGYSQQRIRSFGEELRHSVKAVPGVTSAVIATVPVLMDSDEGGGIAVEGEPPAAFRDESRNHALRNHVSAGFFSGVQIPVIAGREFNDSDCVPGSKSVVVNQTFVRRLLPERNPIGVHLGFGSGQASLDRTIVGVVADSKHSSIRSPVAPFIYLPYVADERLSSLTFYVRVHSDEQTVMPEIRTLVHRIDPSLPVNQLSSLAQIIDESLFVERSLGYLSVAFAILATLLVIVGLYGVMRYSVTRRVRELGIRMALGASPEKVIAMVLRESALLGVAGIACAVPFVIATASYLRSSLYGVRADDPVAWLSAATLLIAVALAAGFGPAWGASRIDPYAALKTD